MAKRKRRRKKNSWSRQFAYEVIGLAIFALSAIALARLGAAGRALVEFFRFFGGSWYSLFLVGLFLTSFHLIWKREMPHFWTRRLTGCYLFTFSILLLSHVQLFQNLTANGEWQNHSVIASTWNLYWDQLHGLVASDDLGGGMIGAVGFAFCYVLFDAEGTQLVAIILMIMSFILITGKSLGATLSSMFSGVGEFIKNQFELLRQELHDWKTDMQAKRSQRKNQKSQPRTKSKKEANAVSQATEQEGHDSDQDEEQVIEPIIHDFNEYDAGPRQSLATPAPEQPKPEDTTKASDDSQESPAFLTSEVENEDYELPPMDLLTPPQKSSQNLQKQYIHENARKLERTFESFGVRAKIRKVHV
ncbi:MAG TPA: DNA translocase FtsK, partial [Bacillales bacterium]|nr:DNA translocase FtsK [Bacillales bacterium]